MTMDWTEFARRQNDKTAIYRGPKGQLAPDVLKTIEIVWDPYLGNEMTSLLVDILEPELAGVRDAVVKFILSAPETEPEPLVHTQATPHHEQLVQDVRSGKMFATLLRSTMGFRVIWTGRLGTRLEKGATHYVGRTHYLFEPILDAMQPILERAALEASADVLVRHRARAR
jgi:hypothetical protein